MDKTVLVIGATSGIAASLSEEFAREGYSLFLAGRDRGELERIAQDLQIRYSIDVKVALFDAEKFDRHKGFVNDVVAQVKDLVGVVVAFGLLGEQKVAAEQFSEAEKIINVNFTAVCSVLTYLANYFEEKGSGFIIGISSVAGDRGRQSNYLYGSAKAGMSAYLQGLRNRLAHAGVHVMTVKPGFVDTPMIQHLEKSFLTASPQYVAKKIYRALQKGKNTFYVPWFWRYIMFVVKMVPEPIFKKLKM